METKTYNLFDTQNISNIFEGLKIADYTKEGTLEQESDLDVAYAINNKLDNLTISETLFCSFCNVGFSDKGQQRHHYKLDWHRYNLKQNLLGRASVSEDQFQQCVDDVSSISGSETDSEQGEDESREILQSKPNKKVQSSAKNKNSNSYRKDMPLDQEDSLSDSVISRNSKLFFENSKGQIISIYRCVIQGKKNTSSDSSEIASLAKESTRNCMWGIIMLGGGHFAGAVFEGNEILLHKTFHSYTVRAKQGGSQSMRDNKTGGGSHPKSAGASLRRYNEASLAQHVQDIVSEWNKKLAECSVLFFRAVSHNRNILFGGRSPLFNKNDPRIRNIPFATRRATFKEVKRVHEQLSSITVYSSIEMLKNSLLESALKKSSVYNNDSCHSSGKCSTSKNDQEKLEMQEQNNRNSSPQKSGIDRAKARRSPHRPLPDVVNDLGRSSPESDNSNNYVIDILLTETEISLSNSLVEFEDTVPEAIKKQKRGKSKDKKVKKKKDIPAEEKCEPIVFNFYKKLKTACRLGDISLLKLNLEEVVNEEFNDSTNQRNLLDEDQTSSRPITVTDLNKCLNDLNDINGNTLLHIASEQGHCEIVRMLLSHGSDPCKKNKKHQTPYVISKDKETRNAFRRFLADFPDKFDYSESQIPSPLSDEIEKEMSEKRRAQRKAKREREKIRKLEEDKRRAEESERERFLRLSDREKRAFAAEMRILAQVQRNGGEKPIISRCFQCAKDITGLVPFEYDICRFCSMDCLKIHRVSYKKS